MDKIELYGATIKCLGVNAGTPKETNNTIDEGKNFHMVRLSLNNPIKVYETEKSKSPINFNNRIIRHIEENEDGNITVKTLVASYVVKIH